MEHWLDDVARTVASGVSRRQALRRIGGGFAAAVAASLGLAPKEALAACPTGTRQCQAGGPCCPGTCCAAGGACCTGCCTSGTLCRAGTLRAECGNHGAACVSCSGPTVDTCSATAGGGGTCSCGSNPGPCPTGTTCSNGVCSCPSPQIVCGANCKLPNGQPCPGGSSTCASNNCVNAVCQAAAIGGSC